MASDTDICNMALSYLGANKIIEMTDKTTEASLCQLNFDFCRDAILEEVNWSFAKKRFVLAAPDKDKPAFGYGFSFVLPVNVLRVITVNDNKVDWEIEDRRILTDSSSLNILAIIRITDSSKFSPMFIQAFAAYLAAEIALPLTNSTAQQSAMAQMYIAKKRWAQGNDGRQGRSDIRRSHGFKR